jgi:hypothetical protein
MTVEPDEGRAARARWTLVGITLALTAAVVVYRLTHKVGLSQTGAFFVGLPAILAITGPVAPGPNRQGHDVQSRDIRVAPLRCASR